MTANITEIARTATTAYGISFIVCTNEETNRDTLGLGLDSDCAIREAVSAAEDAAIEAITKAGCDCETNSTFAKWNGGPYTGMVYLQWHVADIIEPEGFDDDEQDLVGPEDTRDEWQPAWLVGAGKTDIPAEIVAKGEAIYDAAMDAARAQVVDLV